MAIPTCKTCTFHMVSCQNHEICEHYVYFMWKLKWIEIERRWILYPIDSEKYKSQSKVKGE